ncbi:MAG: arginine deiminase family protein [Candidatus Peribacteraceae bacterium]|nr:arginine deiminase family protein [Candidatus Peribacteraceae bacterium]
MLTAITRDFGSEITQCELTHIERIPINVTTAKEQHETYENALREAGAHVIRLPVLANHPDAVFVEDTAIILPEVAVITVPGSDSRRGEESTIAEALKNLQKELIFLTAPATLEGGDVMRVDRTLFVGSSTRTNPEGIRQLQKALEPRGYRVVPIKVTGCLHLKTGCTCIGKNRILVNPSWIDVNQFHNHELIAVDSHEPFAANSLLIGDTLLYSTRFPLTQTKIQKMGLQTTTIDISELEKAEAGLTCMSLIF